MNITKENIATLKATTTAATTIEQLVAAATEAGHTLVATEPIAAKAELTQILDSWTEPIEGSDKDSNTPADDKDDDKEEVLPTALTEELVEEMKTKTFAKAGGSDYLNRAALAGKTVTGYFKVTGKLEPVRYAKADGSLGDSFAFFQEIGEGVWKITHVLFNEYDLIRRATRYSDKEVPAAKYNKQNPIGVMSCSISFANDERGTIKLA